MLIEALHAVQDECRCLSPGHLAAVAREFRLSLVEVYETATFYHHFDVLADGDAPPPEVTVRVCDSISCELAGATALLENLRARRGSDVRILPAPCMGACDRAPAVAVGRNRLAPADAASVAAAVDGKRTAAAVPEYVGYDDYLRGGGYRILKECRSGARTPEDVADALEEAGLRGLGGAGFPTGRKWKIVAGQPGPRMMAVNADEGEPGTFKDRHFMEADPHRFPEAKRRASSSFAISRPRISRTAGYSSRRYT